MRSLPARSKLVLAGALSVFSFGCATKSPEQTAASTRPCNNYVLVIDNTTDSSARIYRGNVVVTDVRPGGTQTIAIRTPQEARSYKAVMSPAGSAAGVIFRSECQ